MSKFKNEILLIPSYEPEDTLITYVNELCGKFENVIIVNDGSKAPYQYIFDQLETVDGCTVVSYEENMGKGFALKTGYSYILQHFPDARTIITADSDGQHSTKDIIHIAMISETEEQPFLILGQRDFSSENVPFKSCWGNRCTSLLFCLLNGKWLKDTQTGLRCFSTSLLNEMMLIEGNRFEYELNVLITCVRKRILIREVPIQTIYESQNKGTHFDAVRDSIRIMKVLFKEGFKFIASSLSCTVLDLLLAFFLFDFIGNNFSFDRFVTISLGTFIARIFSMVANYTINKHVVFEAKQQSKTTFLKYVCLAILIMMLSSTGVYVLSSSNLINEKISKIIVDITLFLISYRVQKDWIFHEKQSLKVQRG